VNKYLTVKFVVALCWHRDGWCEGGNCCNLVYS